jgi:stress response protein YsnF
MESLASKTDNNNTSSKQENENKKEDFFREDKNPLVISPPESETVTILVKSPALKDKESFKSRVGEAFESVRENASNIVDKVMKVEEQDINSFRTATYNNKSTSNPPEQQKSKEQYVIPIIGENYSLNKITLSDEINIEKRWVEQDEIKIPVRYEKVFVDDIEFDAYSETHGIVSQIKDKISDLFHSSNEEDEEEKNEEGNGKSPQGIVGNSNNNDFKNEEKTTTITTTTKNSDNNQQQLIPLYAEEITISKKIVKVGEIAISKRRIVEKENVDVDMIKERINVEYGDGRKEKITPY